MRHLIEHDYERSHHSSSNDGYVRVPSVTHHTNSQLQYVDKRLCSRRASLWELIVQQD